MELECGEKLLSIIIPSYNVESTLESTVDSIIKQEFLRSLEVIIIDDGSKDKTPDIADCIATNYPKTVRVIHKNNGGHGSTINIGIKSAKGKYFKVLDGDDWIDGRGLGQLLRMISETDCDVIWNPYITVNDKTKEENLLSPNYSKISYKTEYKFDDICNHFDMPMHTATFKTEILKKIPMLDENCFYVDAEYVFFPIPLIETVIFLKQPVYRYRVFSNTQSMNKSNLQKNVNQHLRVVKRLLHYYEENKKYNSDIKNLYLKKRMKQIIETQYGIYFSFRYSKSIKNKLIEFSDYIKANSLDAYVSTDNKLIKMFRIQPTIIYPIAVFRNYLRK